jgi:acid phosphatase type 7
MPEEAIMWRLAGPVVALTIFVSAAPGPGKPPPGKPHPGKNAIVITAAGDIATSGSGDSQTAVLIQTLDPSRVLTLGDNAYPDGTLEQFNRYYDPTWGAFKEWTSPSPGNHDYHTAGASGYFTYFGSRAPAPNYTYLLGSWRVVSLDSEMNRGAARTFLHNTLTSDSHLCELVYFHHPRWSSGQHGSALGMDAIWDTAVAHGVDVVLNGHDHNYERFAQLDSSGQPTSDGTRQFVVGTGGAPLRDPGSPIPGSEKRIKAWGVLRMDLWADSYGWSFRNVSNSILDSGTTHCHA